MRAAASGKALVPQLVIAFTRTRSSARSALARRLPGPASISTQSASGFEHAPDALEGIWVAAEYDFSPLFQLGHGDEDFAALIEVLEGRRHVSRAPGETEPSGSKPRLCPLSKTCKRLDLQQDFRVKRVQKGFSHPRSLADACAASSQLRAATCSLPNGRAAPATPLTPHCRPTATDQPDALPFGVEKRVPDNEPAAQPVAQGEAEARGVRGGSARNRASVSSAWVS